MSALSLEVQPAALTEPDGYCSVTIMPCDLAHRFRNMSADNKRELAEWLNGNRTRVTIEQLLSSILPNYRDYDDAEVTLDSDGQIQAIEVRMWSSRHREFFLQDITDCLTEDQLEAIEREVSQ